MKFQDHSFNSSNGYVSYKMPIQCPLCKNGGYPDILSESTYYDDQNNYLLACAYNCKICFKAFVLVVSLKLDEDSSGQYSVAAGRRYTQDELIQLGPVIPQKANMDKELEDTFPEFVKIYNEAIAAEEYGLMEVAGIGYRKATEFLVKDFLKWRHPGESEKIENTPLGSLVINDPNDKEEISRKPYFAINEPLLSPNLVHATWLGNDQTHYIQRFSDDDMFYLKRFLRAAINYIEMALIALTEPPQKQAE